MGKQAKKIRSRLATDRYDGTLSLPKILKELIGAIAQAEGRTRIVIVQRAIERYALSSVEYLGTIPDLSRVQQKPLAKGPD